MSFPRCNIMEYTIKDIMTLIRFMAEMERKALTTSLWYEPYQATFVQGVWLGQMMQPSEVSRMQSTGVELRMSDIDRMQALGSSFICLTKTECKH